MRQRAATGALVSALGVVVAVGAPQVDAGASAGAIHAGSLAGLAGICIAASARFTRMNRNALAALTAVNLIGLLALAGSVALRGDAESRPPASGDEARRLADLEERLARLEAAAREPGLGRAEATALPTGSPEASVTTSATSGPPATVLADDGPVTRSQVEALVREQLARRDATAQEAAKRAAPAARPKRSLPDVARELGLDARQESSVRDLMRQLERDSMKVLFEVEDDVGLERLKAELAQAENDPRLKEQLRERLAVNWTRRQSEIGVLWVRLDARLRETLGTELQKRFYGFEVQLEPREFPDLQQMFFAPPAEGQ
jgi:hypothetical protein